MRGAGGAKGAGSICRVRKTSRAVLFLSSAFLAVTVLSSPSYAFYEYQGEGGYAEFRGFVRLTGGLNLNPDNRTLYDDPTDYFAGAVSRLLVDADLGEERHFEFNAYEFVYYSGAGTGSADIAGTTPAEVERSSALSWEQARSPDTVAVFAVDRLNARLVRDRVDLTVGRQAVNLATTFYFTPNDFFGPFAAQNFFRVYKPGVDAIRGEARLGALSQLSVIGVLGYEPSPGSPNGWAADPGMDKSSLLARISTSTHGLEWALLGGVVREKTVVGASLQGEVSQWLGVRAEGHYAAPEDGSMDDYVELSFGVEHNFTADLFVRGEFFYHGSGAGNEEGYGEELFSTDLTLPYLARRYLAAGGGYRVTPLLTVDGLVAANLVDGSVLGAVNALYSLSDESEVSIGLVVPVGEDTPTGEDVDTEFGLYPVSANVEFRFYF